MGYKGKRKKILKETIALASENIQKTSRRLSNHEKLRTAFVRAVNPAKHDDTIIRSLIVAAKGTVESILPFNDGTCQYKVKIAAGYYTGLKEGYPLLESRLDKPFEGPSTFKPIPKLVPTVN